jgi:hypothetical protein
VAALSKIELAPLSNLGSKDIGQALKDVKSFCLVGSGQVCSSTAHSEFHGLLGPYVEFDHKTN